MPGPRRGLAARLGAVMAVLAAGLILAGIAVVWLRTQQLTAPALDRAVLRALDLVRDTVAARQERLDLITRVLANDPPFRAYVAEGDRASILDNLQERLSLYGCDAFLIVDARGTTLADTRRGAASTGSSVASGAGATAAAPRSSPPTPLARALEGSPSRGVWLDDDGRIYLAAAAPLFTETSGALVALEAIDADLMATLRQITGSDLIVYAGQADAPRATVTTLAMPPASVARVLADAAGTPGPSRRVGVEGEEFVAASSGIPADEGMETARFIVMRSVDRELAAFRQIETALLLVGVVALPLALALGLLVARRITRPLAALARATERVRAGDYTVTLPPESADELGELTGAFRTMVARLREKEDLDAWIGAISARVAGRDRAPAGAASPDAITGPSGSMLETRERVAPLPPPEIRPGALLVNRFRILEPLGAGGMGTVWKARDESLGEFVAIKVLSPETAASRPDLTERFRQEIRLARRITHRNVLRTHELLELGGTFAILMECVDGVPLGRILEEGRMPLAAALRIARQICAGLDAAHAQGVVHRDLKPGNVLVDSSGGVKIADFGLARSLDAAGEATRAGMVMGTPHYMSPEQASGRPADPRSDIYAAGVILFEMLCGARPFRAETTLALLRAHVETPPPSPRTLNPALSPALEQAILRALAKDPAQRHPTARALSEALEAAASGGGG